MKGITLAVNRAEKKNEKKQNFVVFKKFLCVFTHALLTLQSTHVKEEHVL